MNALVLLSVLAQSSRPPSPEETAGGLLSGLCCCMVPFIFILAVFLPAAIGAWKVYEKAGQPGYGALIPIYNIILRMRIIGEEDSRVIFYFIPIYGIVVAIQDVIALAKCFGKDSGFALGMIFLAPIFWPILGFGDAQYTPPPKAGQRAY